jgi:hypothetical protein
MYTKTIFAEFDYMGSYQTSACGCPDSSFVCKSVSHTIWNTIYVVLAELQHFVLRLTVR